MSLRRRMSQHPPPGLSYIDETMAHIEIDDTTLAEPKAGQHLNRLELEQENKQLRLELEDVKKLLDWYVHNSTRRTQNSSPIKSNNKRSPPPSVPTLRQQALISSGKYRTAHRKGPDQIELSAVSLGLHHRRTPGEEEDMFSNSRIALLKSKDSNDHLPDDVESPSPRYACKEGVSLPLLQNDSFGEEEDAILKDENDDDNTTDIGFGVMIMDRAGWLVGLLVLQSMSSFIIQRNEGLLQKHLVIVRFLTMLVGAGGNAGNQASVRVIRGLAIGTIKTNAVRPFLLSEIAVGLCLSIILGISGWLRAAVFATPFLETVAITASLFMIVMISVVLGATLPLGMKLVGIDPAHSSTTIQVLMDILGVTITVVVSGLVFGPS